MPKFFDGEFALDCSGSQLSLVCSCVFGLLVCVSIMRSIHNKARDISLGWLLVWLVDSDTANKKPDSVAEIKQVTMDERRRRLKYLLYSYCHCDMIHVVQEDDRWILKQVIQSVGRCRTMFLCHAIRLIINNHCELSIVGNVDLNLQPPPY